MDGAARSLTVGESDAVPRYSTSPSMSAAPSWRRALWRRARPAGFRTRAVAPSSLTTVAPARPMLRGPAMSRSRPSATARRAAVGVANKAAELMGSNGISPEYHLEKYLRDSKVPQLWLGGQQVTRYRVIRGYYDYVV